MNTITRKQYSAIWQSLNDYTEKEKFPDFWTLGTLDASGQQCGEDVAIYAAISVQDFDNKHDLSFLRQLLSAHGVNLNERDMLDSFDLVRIEREEEERPRKAAFVDGSGELGRVYEYQLILAD